MTFLLQSKGVCLSVFLGTREGEHLPLKKVRVHWRRAGLLYNDSYSRQAAHLTEMEVLQAELCTKKDMLILKQVPDPKFIICMGLCLCKGRATLF